VHGIAQYVRQTAMNASAKMLSQTEHQIVGKEIAATLCKEIGVLLDAAVMRHRYRVLLPV